MTSKRQLLMGAAHGLVTVHPMSSTLDAWAGKVIEIMY
jgi:hypothetical protein